MTRTINVAAWARATFGTLPLRRIALAALICSILGVLAWPVWPWRSTETIELQITALGEKNPASHGSEVWLNGWPEGVSAARLARRSSTKLGWEVRGPQLLSYRDQPATIAMRTNVAPDGSFTFGRHDYSGRVRLTINGVTRVLDLYAADPGQGPIVVPLSDFPLGAIKPFGFLGRFLRAVGIAAAAVFVALAGLGVLLARLQPGAEPSRPLWRDAVALALPSLAVFSLVLAGTWPAQMSPDSVGQWNQLHTGVFDNGHPVIETILVGGPGYLFGTIGVSMAIQIVLLALAIGLFCAEMVRWRVPPTIVACCAVATPMFPSVALLSTADWKDIPYSIAFAVVAALSLMIARTDGAATKSRAFAAAVALALFMAAAMRHNGVVAVAGVVLVLAIVFGRKVGARVVVAWATAGVVVPLLWTLAVIPALGVPNPGKHYGGLLPMHFLAGVTAAGRELPSETIQRMQEILPLEQWRERYDCLSAVPLFWAPGIKYERLDASLFGLALKAAIANPDIALGHALCMNAINWRLSPPHNAEYALTVLGVVSDPTGPHPWSESARPLATVKALVDGVFYATISTPSSFVIVWRPAAIFLVLIGLVVLLGRRTRAYVALLPVVMNIVSLIPLISSQDFRYQYPAYVVGIPVAFLLLSLWGSTLAERGAQGGRADARAAVD